MPRASSLPPGISSELNSPKIEWLATCQSGVGCLPPASPVTNLSRHRRRRVAGTGGVSCGGAASGGVTGGRAASRGSTSGGAASRGVTGGGAASRGVTGGASPPRSTALRPAPPSARSRHRRFGDDGSAGVDGQGVRMAVAHRLTSCLAAAAGNVQCSPRHRIEHTSQ